jgi:hypothetical protein
MTKNCFIWMGGVSHGPMRSGCHIRAPLALLAHHHFHLTDIVIGFCLYRPSVLIHLSVPDQRIHTGHLCNKSDHLKRQAMVCRRAPAQPRLNHRRPNLPPSYLDCSPFLRTAIQHDVPCCRWAYVAPRRCPSSFSAKSPRRPSASERYLRRKRFANILP